MQRQGNKKLEKGLFYHQKMAYFNPDESLRPESEVFLFRNPTN
jgi:hypothetical protein